MFDPYAPIVQVPLLGPSFGGRINRYQSVLQSVSDQQVAGSKIALNQDKVSRCSLVFQPRGDWNEDILQRRRVWGDKGPETSQVFRWQDDLGDRQFSIQSLMLILRESVVEKQKDSGQRITPQLCRSCFHLV